MAYEYLSQFTRSLNNLSALLDKLHTYSEHRKIEDTVLLNGRLFPDQFHFTRQVQIACDTAKAFAGRLTGKDIPKHADEEKTVGELKQRIQKTIEYLGTIKE